MNIREWACLLLRLVGIVVLTGMWSVFCQRMGAPGWLQTPVLAAAILSITSLQWRLSTLYRPRDSGAKISLGRELLLDALCRAPLFQEVPADKHFARIDREGIKLIHAWRMLAGATYYATLLTAVSRLFSMDCVREGACLLLSSYVVGLGAIALLPIQSLRDSSLHSIVPVRVGVIIRFTWINLLLLLQMMCYLVAGSWGFHLLLSLWVIPCLINAFRRRRSGARRKTDARTIPKVKAA